MKLPSIPPTTVVYTGPGEHLPALEPGDVLLIRRHGALPAMIRFFQRLRRPRGVRKAEWGWYCRVSHACSVVEGSPHAIIAQAEANGIELSDAESFDAPAVAVIRFLVPDVQIKAGVQFAYSTVGTGYGFLQIVADAFNALTGLELSLGAGDRMVCSTQTCRVAERFGMIADRAPAAVTPAHLARYFRVVVPAI